MNERLFSHATCMDLVAVALKFTSSVTSALQTTAQAHIRVAVELFVVSAKL